MGLDQYSKDKAKQNIEVVMSVKMISQAELARNMGTTRQYVCQSLKNPTDMFIERFAEVCDFSEEKIRRADLRSEILG
jgi:hypothetical protein